MLKIANTNELQDELRSLLSYAQSERPSRVRIAAELEALSRRVIADRVAAKGGLSKALKLLEQAEAALKDTPKGDWMALEVNALKTKLMTLNLFKKGDEVIYSGTIPGTVTKNQKPGASTVEVDLGYSKPALVNVDELSRS